MSDDVDTLDRAVFFKERTEHVFRCRKTQIPDEDLLHTFGFTICDYSGLQRVRGEGAGSAADTFCRSENLWQSHWGR